MRQLEQDFFVSGQIRPEDVPNLAERGFRMIINNRPDGEVRGQPEGGEIGIAARAAGLAYHTIPLSSLSLLSADAVEETQRAINKADGPILAFCAAGTRSTLLWALARSEQGWDAEDLTARAAAAGYDLTPVRRFMR